MYYADTMKNMLFVILPEVLQHLWNCGFLLRKREVRIFACGFNYENATKIEEARVLWN
jgi:hypothetical protein